MGQRLKHSEIKPHRQQLLIQQNSKCALCGDIIIDDAVLDHDHKTGKIRQVLHRGCNAMLGKIENNLARNRLTTVRLNNFLTNLIVYIEKEYEDVVHPTYKTKEERIMAYKKKRKKTPGKKY